MRKQVGDSVWFRPEGPSSDPFPAIVLGLHGDDGVVMLNYHVAGGLIHEPIARKHDHPDFVKHPKRLIEDGCWEEVPPLAFPFPDEQLVTTADNIEPPPTELDTDSKYYIQDKAAKGFTAKKMHNYLRLKGVKLAQIEAYLEELSQPETA